MNYTYLLSCLLLVGFMWSCDSKNKPVVEEAIVEELIVEEPIVEKTIVEASAVEEPIVEESIIEEPIVEEPIVGSIEELSEKEPSSDDEVMEQMPSPLEMVELIKNTGGKYNPRLLNGIKKISGYLGNGKKTINLGVYSADVGYTSVYKQTQETVFYLNNVKKLSDAIGISDAFDQQLFERVEAEIGNHDTLLHILSGASEDANQYLKNNDRMNTSVLMIAGGWIESMYLAAHLGENGARPETRISLRILEQESVLHKIIKSMKVVNGDPLVDEFVAKLEQLDKILVQKEIRIGEGEESTVDSEKMEPVFKLIDDIRKWVVA